MIKGPNQGSKNPKSLKAKNLKWLVPFFGINALVLAGAILGFDEIGNLLRGKKDFPSFQSASIGALAVLATVGAGALFPSVLKDALVFWRIKHILPGHRAFSVYASHDPRVTKETLKAKLGPLPKAPKEQNVVWYGLLKKHEGRVEIADAHQMFLLFRDACALAFLSLVAFGITEPFVRPVAGAWWALFFAAEFVLLSIIARNFGVRLVCNVLAIEALK